MNEIEIESNTQTQIKTIILGGLGTKLNELMDLAKQFNNVKIITFEKNYILENSIIDVVNKINITSPCNLICISVGGLIGLTYYKYYPHNILSIILLDITNPLSSDYLKKMKYFSILNGLDNLNDIIVKIPIISHINIIFKTENLLKYESKVDVNINLYIDKLSKFQKAKYLYFSGISSKVICHFNIGHDLHLNIDVIKSIKLYGNENLR